MSDKKIPTSGPVLSEACQRVMEEGTRQRYAISAGELSATPAKGVKK